MKKMEIFPFRILIFILINLLITSAYSVIPAPVTDIFNGGRGSDFNGNWKFQQGDVTGGYATGFDDSGWRKLSLPHDWSIEQPFNQNSAAGGGGGYLDGGIGWYRKTFYLPDSVSGKRITIQFEGIYMNSTIWINGQQLGTRPYGYSSFEYDLTPYIKTGSTANVIAVKVNNNQPNSRWYSGSGIYRNVWLTVTDPVHVAYCGSFITTTSVSVSSAIVTAATRVQNHSKSAQTITLVTTVYDRFGNGVSSATCAPVSIGNNDENTFGLKLRIENPVLWSITNPYLYTVKTQIFTNNKVTDTFTSTLGVRSITVNPDTGFWLNDQNIKLHGVCMHHDLGSLGAAQNYSALERQVEILKSFGCNAIRTSHNPPAPELLDICDRLGLVVMDEAFDCWETGKNVNDYGQYFDTWAQQDVQDWVRRDRNHASVLMWSIGNEIPQQGDASGYTIAQKLIKWVLTDDPTRPITQALNYEDLLGPLLGIVGYNYASGATYDNDHKNHPLWVIMGSETSSAVRTRGVYHMPASQNNLTDPDMQCSSYDNSVVPWGHSAEDSWDFDKSRPFVIGQFIWTGFDYIGEPTPYGWPAKSSYFGIVDMCGFPKDIYYFYQSQWTSKPMVHLLPHWNWAAGDTIPIWAYSNCDSVSLFVNGIYSGTKQVPEIQPFHPEWNVPFKAGKIKALAFKNGAVAASDSIATSVSASKIRLKSNRDTILADTYDQAFIETDMIDAAGIPDPDAANQITYSISGPGKIAGVDNGNPLSLESFKGTTRQIFNGKALAIVQSTGQEGQIVLTASAPPVLNNIALCKPSHSDSEVIYTMNNIAVGKTASSDSQQGNNPVQAGNDGNNETRWCAIDGNAGHWWKLDLGANHSITGTEIYWEHISAYQYKIETSTNNSTWKIVANKTSNSISSQTMDDSFSETARYIRITITGGVDSGNWASFFEFRVFDGTYTISPGKNLATSANDGSVYSYWVAADGNPGHSWSVDLGSIINLTGSQMVWLTSGNAYKYKIEVSSDSINWLLTADKTNSTLTSQTETDNFIASARYVKITITGGTTNINKAGFSEFRLFDGTYTTISPASISITCIKPVCATCLVDSIRIKPLVNINNSGWQQAGSALLCKGGIVSFSALSSDTTGWLWNGPDGYTSSKRQIDFTNVQLRDTGVYKLTHKNNFFNFNLKLIEDSITPFFKINNEPFNQGNSATVQTGDTIILSPVPVDSIGWKWSWTGPGGFSSASRAVKIAVNDTMQSGKYTANGSDGFNCGNSLQTFYVTVNIGTGISEVGTTDIEIYPNPSYNGLFNLKNCENCKVSVYTLLGKLIWEKTGSTDVNVIDLSNRTGGIYIIRLSSDKINSFKKVIIQ